MARKKLDLPKWTGALSTPIDTGVRMDLSSEKTISEYIAKDSALTAQAQVAKLDELGMALGLAPPAPASSAHTDQEKWKWLFDRLSFLNAVTISLAMRIGIPGFLVRKPGKRRDEVIAHYLALCELIKPHKDFACALGLKPQPTDLEICTSFVKLTNPEWAKRPNSNSAVLKSEARELSKRVAQLRAKQRRAAEQAERDRVAEQRPKRLN